MRAIRLVLLVTVMGVVGGSAWAAAEAQTAAPQDAAKALPQTYRRTSVVFPSALLGAAEQGQRPLLAEVGTWKARWPAHPYTATPENPNQSWERVVKGAGFRMWEADGWHLARGDKWYMFTRYDCGLDLLRRIDEDGGLTPETAGQVMALSKRQRNTLRTWLGRQEPDGGGSPRCPEMKQLDDPRAMAGLGLWALLTPRQWEAAATTGLGPDEMQPAQQAALCQVLWQAQGVRCSDAAAAGPRVRLRPPGPEMLSSNPIDLTLKGEPLGTTLEVELPNRAPTGGPPAGMDAEALRFFQERHMSLPALPDPGRIAVDLPVVDAETRAARRERESLLDALKIGRMESRWPEEEQRSGLSTPFTLWCKVVKVKDVLLSVSRECGVDLRADRWAGERGLVAQFEDKTVDEFRAALADLLKCEWQWDEEDGYWLLYQPEALREEEERLAADYLADEARQRKERLSSDRGEGSSALAGEIMAAVGADTAQRIREGGRVSVYLSDLPPDLRTQVADFFLLYSRHQHGWDLDLTSDALVWGMLEFEPNDVYAGSDMVFQYAFSTGEHGMHGGRTQLGPAF